MRSHISHLDRAITRLLDERARLTRELERTGSSASAEPFTADLLRRADGDFPALALRAVFAEIDRGCREAAEVPR